MTETEGARQRKGKEGEQGPERKDQPAASKEIKKEEKKKGKGSSLCAILFFLLLILAGVLGYYVHKQNEKFNLPEFKKVKKVTTGISDEVKGEMLEKRHPRLFTHAISPNILTLSSFVGNFSHIKLSKAQRSTTGIFAPFDSESPLVDARYLATTGSVDDVIDLQAGEFWKDPLSAKGLYYFYEAQTYRDFRAYAQNLPADFPLEKQGSSSPRVMFATQGSRTKPYNYHSNTYLAVLDGAIDVVLFPPSESHDLYPYPEYHPNFGSGQVLYQENYPLADRVEILLKYPRILKAKGVKTSASAGDILYIPPFWFSQITFKKPSILLKTFSPMYESEVLHELLHLEVPHSDNLDTQIFVVKKLIDWFVPPSLGVSSTQFIKDLVNTRYLPLYKDLSIETTTDFTPCHQEDPETEKEVREFSEMTLNSIKKFSTALEDMKRVRLIVMEQYVEHLIQKTISAEDAYNFYLHCFPLGLDNSRSTAQDIE